MSDAKKRPFPLMQIITVLLFPAVLFYYESVFKLSTVGGYGESGTWFMFLFSIAYGGIGYLLSTCTKNKKVNYWITLSLIILTTIPFFVEYFIHRQFKIFYDIKSIFGSASDAVGGFSADIVAMIFSIDGFVKITLFLIPTILYAIFGRRLAEHQKATWLHRGIAVGAMLVLFLGASLGLKAVPYLSGLYGNQYHFQEAIEQFGVMTGIRLDIQDMITEEEDSFELEATLPTMPPLPTEPPVTDSTDVSDPTGTEVIEPPTTEPIVYTPNQMELNFDPNATGKVKELNDYVQSLTASMKNEFTGLFKGKNLIMITAEAFTAEVIDPELTPTLYRLATKGIQFTDYYQTADAGTTGGEYLHIFGMNPTDGGESFKNTQKHLNYFTMGSQLNRLGYFGQAYHNNSYTYYDRHKTHINLGYSEGFMGYGNGMEKYVKKQWPQSDLEMIQGTLPLYIDKQPFNMYYMTVSGHSNYKTSGNRIVKQNWDRVSHLECSDIIKGYFAAQLGLEDALTYLVEQLELAGIADDTVICLTTDHYPYGVKDDVHPDYMYYLKELYGYPVENYFQRDHSRLILWCGALEKMDPIIVDEPTSVVDILPTLSNLFGTEFDSRLMPGRDVFSDAPVLVYNSHYDWKTEYGTYISKTGKFTPAVEGMEIPEDYIKAMKQIVRNKLRYCEGVLDTDYFRTLFPDAE